MKLFIVHTNIYYFFYFMSCVMVIFFELMIQELNRKHIFLKSVLG